MAREMYLAGVDPEELKPDEQPEEPQTPKERWKNFWFYYKWWVLAIAVVLVIVGVATWQMMVNPNPDYRVVLVTKDVMDEPGVDGLEAALQPFGRDLNGDGQVIVTVENLPLAQYVGGATYGMAETNTQKLAAYLVSADAMFYIFDEPCYNRYLSQLMESMGDKSAAFFADPGITADGLDAEGHYWQWTENAREQAPFGELMPEDLYFGVRKLGGTASGDAVTERYANCMQLLTAYIQSTSVPGALE